MKCPTCGSELPDGALFCEKCAGEIKIVPEYETRLEEQISISMESVTKVIEEEKAVEADTVPIDTAAVKAGISAQRAADAKAVEAREEAARQRQERREQARMRRHARYASRRRYVKFMLVFLVGALSMGIFILLLWVGGFFNDFRSQSYYVGRAYQYASSGEYHKAADEIDKAIALDRGTSSGAGDAATQDSAGDLELSAAESSEDMQEDSGPQRQTVATLYLLKAEYLQKAGEEGLALGAASQAMEDPSSTEEEDIAAYGRMIAIYASYEEYDKIAELLSKCTRQQVIESYLQYALFEPEFSAEDGTYDAPFSLELKDEGEGSIFYTLDGSVPTTSSVLYTGPIELSEGTWKVSAIYVNHFNLSSQVVTKTYRISPKGGSEK